MARNTITWRNINAPSFAGVQSGLSAAGDSVARGMETLAKTVKGIGDAEHKQFNDERDFRTQGFLDQIAGLDNLEGYDALNNSIRQEVAGLGAGVDTSKIYAALGQRDDTLRTDALNTHQYNETQRGIAEKPFIDEVSMLIADNKNEEAKARLTQLRKDGTIGEDSLSKLYGALDTEVKSDTAYARNEEDRRQQLAMASIVTKAGQQIDDPDDVTSFVEKHVKAAGITGDNVNKLRIAAAEESARANAPSQKDLKALDELSSRYQQAPELITQSRNAQKKQEGLLVKEDELKGWEEQYDPSAAIKYIGENSGESNFYSNDTPGIFSDGVQGREYAIEYANKGVKNVELDLRNKFSKSAYKDDPIAQKIMKDGLPGVVIQRAFDETPRDEDGEWSYKKFQENLETQYEAYILHKRKVEASDLFDQETNVLINQATNEGIEQIKAESKRQYEERMAKKRR